MLKEPLTSTHTNLQWRSPCASIAMCVCVWEARRRHHHTADRNSVIKRGSDKVLLCSERCPDELYDPPHLLRDRLAAQGIVEDARYGIIASLGQIDLESSCWPIQEDRELSKKNYPREADQQHHIVTTYVRQFGFPHITRTLLPNMV